MHHTSLDVIKTVMTGGANNGLQRLILPSPFVIPPTKNPLLSRRTSQTKNILVVGLRNIGNSCFLNAVVQVHHLNQNTKQILRFFGSTN
jgi:ubiquitin C-terminal hydrolase